ncbi:MAG TPA: putative Ig domain-containing protein [Steroidobacteraceae bacterium]|nr:putative Ig domain-containing protein [Steroidobacteraceae bacterium]
MLTKSLMSSTLALMALAGSALTMSGCNSDSANAADSTGVAVSGTDDWRTYCRRHHLGSCTGSSSSSSSSGGTAANSAPTITGTPATTATVGKAYSFTPTASDANKDTLTFSIANSPSWASFSKTTGALTGTPTKAETDAGIVISVSDGKATTAMASFTITVAAASSTSTGSSGSTSTTTTVVPVTLACSSALTGSHATYNVGPGQTYTELTNVPWLSLVAGDVVNIYYRATPYKTWIGLKAQGTAAKPVVINGVTDASCNRPVIDGSTGAVYAADRATSGFDNQYTQGPNDFYIYWGNGGWANKPKFITIQNLTLTGGSTGIYAVTVEDLLVQNCEITANNGWGIFVNTKNDDPNGEETSYRVTIRGNRIYGNGVSGSYLYHNLYIQSDGALYEGNYIGKLIPGAQGSSLKDRSAGTVIRYNYIVAAARALDLVETEGGHGTVDADPLYPDAWVYGNVIVNDSTLPGVSSGALIHWGYDNTPSEARTGTLHFYDNTLYSNVSGNVLFDQQSDGNVDPDNTVDAQNNILWQSGSGKLLMGKTHGLVNFIGTNWITSGWANGKTGNTETVNITGTLLQGTSPGLDADFRPTTGSPVIGQASGTTATPVLYEFDSPAGVVARPTAKDLGAFEH